MPPLAPPAPSSPGPPTPVPRSLHLALFIAGLLWLLAAHAAALRAADGFAGRLGWGVVGQNLSANIFLLFLLLLGFGILSWIGTRQPGLRRANALPRRPTAREEWSRGAVIGWALALAAVLPLVVAGALRPQFSFTLQSWEAAALSLLSLLTAALAAEVAFRGFLFRTLLAAAGPTAATLLLSAIYALLGTLLPNANGLGFFIMLLGGILFSLAYLRTHALWLGWGMHFTWLATMAVLFGLPLAGDASYSSLVQSDVAGPEWLTGGAFGLEAALLTAVVFLIAMAVVYRATRDYAWSYTHPVIVPGGYPMDVPPPAAHTAMEQQAAATPQPLVQITPAPANPEGPTLQPESTSTRSSS